MSIGNIIKPDLEIRPEDSLESVIRAAMQFAPEIEKQAVVDRVDSWIKDKFQIELINAAKEGPYSEAVCLKIWHRFKKDLKLDQTW